MIEDLDGSGRCPRRTGPVEQDGLSAVGTAGAEAGLNETAGGGDGLGGTVVAVIGASCRKGG